VCGRERERESESERSHTAVPEPHLLGEGHMATFSKNQEIYSGIDFWQEQNLALAKYRGTSLIRNSQPPPRTNVGP